MGVVRLVMAANWSVLLPIAWPESISNQKNKAAFAIATVAAILAAIVILLICKLNLPFEMLRSPASQ